MKKKDNLKEQIAGPHSLKVGDNDLPKREMNPTIGIANTHNFYEKAKGEDGCFIRSFSRSATLSRAPAVNASFITTMETITSFVKRCSIALKNT
jgi:hypothetical protein